MTSVDSDEPVQPPFKTIPEWNKLPNDVKQSQSLNILKTRIRSLYEPLVKNKPYSYGHGLGKVNHCRIRLGLPPKFSFTPL